MGGRPQISTFPGNSPPKIAPIRQISFRSCAALTRSSHSSSAGLPKTVAPASWPAVLRASRPSEPSPNLQLSVVAPLVRNAALPLEGKLRRAEKGRHGLGFGSEIVDQQLKYQALIGRGRPQFNVGAGNQPQRSSEVASALVAASLANEIVGSKRRHAKSLPQSLPDGTGVANVLFQNHEHLPVGSGQHIKVSNGRIFAAIGGVEQAMKHGQRARLVAGTDGIRQLIQ